MAAVCGGRQRLRWQLWVSHEVLRHPLARGFQEQIQTQKSFTEENVDTFEPNSEQDGQPHIFVLFHIFIMRRRNFLWQKLSCSVQTLTFMKHVGTS